MAYHWPYFFFTFQNGVNTRHKIPAWKWTFSLSNFSFCWPFSQPKSSLMVDWSSRHLDLLCGGKKRVNGFLGHYSDYPIQFAIPMSQSEKWQPQFLVCFEKRVQYELRCCKKSVFVNSKPFPYINGSSFWGVFHEIMELLCYVLPTYFWWLLTVNHSVKNCPKKSH